MSKGWDNAMIKKLKALTGKGLSTAEIGKRLGLSKNAIVGKLNRLGWNLKANTTTTIGQPQSSKKIEVSKNTSVKSAVKPTQKTKPGSQSDTSTKKKSSSKKSATPSKTRETKSTLNKNLAAHQRIIRHSLEMANLKPNQCRWPIGDPDSENFHFCGEPVFVGKPYCYEHCKQAYQFTNPPKKK